MNHRKARALLFACSLVALTQAHALPRIGAQSSAVAQFVEGEVLVKLGPGVTRSELQAASITGATVLEQWDFIGWQRLRLPEGLSVHEAVADYAMIPGVEAAQPNYIYGLATTPDDSRYGSLYGMEKIQARAAWDTLTGSSSVVVAVIDTGARYTHEDLAPNMWRNAGEVEGNGVDDDGNGFVDDLFGYDFRQGDGDPNDEHGHGTHVSGIIGGAGNNSVGVAGVNWAVKMMEVKIFGADGTATNSSLLSAFQYVTMMKNRGVNIRVTNNSWGGFNNGDHALQDAIDAVGNAGIVNVFAAGNLASDNDLFPYYPAAFTSPSIIAVASSNENDTRSPFSSYGATSVDLAAPGSEILSSYFFSNFSYAILSGTSMATPHVAGAVALLAALKPSLTGQELKAAVLASVDALPQWAGVVLTGGRLNLARAIQSVLPCALINLPSDAYYTTSGGSVSLGLAPQAACVWNITGRPDWVTLRAENAGGGNSMLTYTVANNTTGASRQAEINVLGSAFRVVQDGGIGSDCTVMATIDKKTFAPGGGAGVITINAAGRCSWQAASSAGWITFNSSSVGIGNQSLAFTVLPNAGSARRKATITVNGVSFSVKQKAD